MSVGETAWNKLTNLVFLVSIFGCIIIISMCFGLSFYLWYDFEWTQTLLVNPVVYGLFALGWVLIILGIVNLGLGRRPGTLERIITPTTRIYNCGCLTGVPILFGLLIGLLYQTYPVGAPLDYFLPLPILTTLGMIVLGLAFIIHNDRLIFPKYAIYIGLLYIIVGGGTFALVQSGIFPLSAGLVIWLLIATGPIFTFPLIIIFSYVRIFGSISL